MIYSTHDFKQLLDEVFVISGIIKVEVNVISRSQRLRLITLTETLIISDITKPNLIIVLLYIVLKQITPNALSHRIQFIFDTPCSYFALRELDIALGNHTLRAQPTDYSLICRYRLVNNLWVALFPRINCRLSANEKTDGEYNV